MENMNKYILLLLIPFIGFSQCENTILDEALTNDSVNQYFQLALSLNIEDLSYLNECNSPNMIGDEYMLFAPGNDIPASAITPLMQNTNGEIIDYINAYIYPENNDMEAIDIATMYDITVLEEICTCNGTIFIIDDLIWNNTVGINENGLSKNVLKRINMLGGETNNKGLYIEIYSDGSFKKLYR